MKEYAQRMYHMQSNDNLVVMRRNQVLQVLLMKYSPSIANKVMQELKLPDENKFTYRTFLEKLSQNLALKSKP